MGLLPYPGLPVPDSVARLYPIVAQRNTPGGASPNFHFPCEANLRGRGIIYLKSRPGDCGAPSGVPGLSSGQVVGLSGSAASGVVGGLGAAGVIAGPATLGISTAVSLAVAGIQDIFAHHAQAVANEQATICAVANYFNPLVKEIDNLVITGQISPDQGVSYMRQIAQQAINGLQSIAKTCNAACYFIGYLKAHMDFASILYPALSPHGPSGLSAQAPGSAPATFGTPPGAVQDAGASAPLRSSSDPGFAYRPAGPPAVTAGGTMAPPVTPNKLLPSGNICSMGGCASDYLNLGYNQQTGQSAQSADVPSIPISTTTLLLVALVIILLAVFL